MFDRTFFRSKLGAASMAAVAAMLAFNVVAFAMPPAQGGIATGQTAQVLSL